MLPHRLRLASVARAVREIHRLLTALRGLKAPTAIVARRVRNTHAHRGQRFAGSRCCAQRRWCGTATRPAATASRRTQPAPHSGLDIHLRTVVSTAGSPAPAVGPRERHRVPPGRPCTSGRRDTAGTTSAVANKTNAAGDRGSDSEISSREWCRVTSTTTTTTAAATVPTTGPAPKRHAITTAASPRQEHTLAHPRRRWVWRWALAVHSEISSPGRRTTTTTTTRRQRPRRPRRPTAPTARPAARLERRHGISTAASPQDPGCEPRATTRGVAGFAAGVCASKDSLVVTPATNAVGGRSLCPSPRPTRP